MSEIIRDKEFYELADEHIALANTRMGQIKPAKVSATMLFAAARFNAFVFAMSSENKAQMELDKEPAIAYFVQEYEKYLRDNIDEHMARHTN